MVDLARFRNGDVMLDEFAVYNADPSGHFTRPAEHSHGDWKMPDLGGLMLNTSGYEPAGFSLQPDPADPSGRRWTLELSFRRYPEPVRR